MIPWELRRGQIKHLLYELCLNGRISWEVFKEHIHELNRVEPIIRCRDCKWYAETEDEEMNIYPTCEHPEEGGGWTSGKDWFCADGERRRDE